MTDAVRVALIVGFTVLALAVPSTVMSLGRPRFTLWLLAMVWLILAGGVQVVLSRWGHPLMVRDLFGGLAVISGLAYVVNAYRYRRRLRRRVMEQIAEYERRSGADDG